MYYPDLEFCAEIHQYILQLIISMRDVPGTLPILADLEYRVGSVEHLAATHLPNRMSFLLDALSSAVCS